MEPPRLPSARALLVNFCKMSFFFSINHGCVTAVLNLAVTLLGKAGSYANATLYIMYAVTALLFSTAIISSTGSRKGLVGGAFLYSVYVAGFPLALLTDPSKHPDSPPPALIAIAITAGAVGGFAAGFLWAAQGAYFAANTKLYAIAKGISQESASSWFAGVFAVIFLGLEVVLKLLAFVIKQFTTSSTSNLIVCIVYSVLALGSVFGLFFIKDLNDSDDKAAQSRSDRSGSFAAGAMGRKSADEGESLEAPLISDVDTVNPTGASGNGKGKCGGGAALQPDKILAAMKLWVDQPKVLLLNPIQVAFGFSASLLGQFVSSQVIKATHPEGVQGQMGPVEIAALLSALTAAVAAALQLPFGAISKRVGKIPLMVFGLGAFVTLGCLCYTQSVHALGQWNLLPVLYVLQGIGRASYEGTNKAVYSDFFPDDSKAAFANVVIACGVSSSLGFFIFPNIDQHDKSALAIAVSVFAIVAYLLAEFVHRRQKNR